MSVLSGGSIGKHTLLILPTETILVLETKPLFHCSSIVRIGAESPGLISNTEDIQKGYSTSISYSENSNVFVSFFYFIFCERCIFFLFETDLSTPYE